MVEYAVSALMSFFRSRKFGKRNLVPRPHACLFRFPKILK
jgi:hypothetical protein